jgi:hypothetical protein
MSASVGFIICTRSSGNSALRYFPMAMIWSTDGGHIPAPTAHCNLGNPVLTSGVNQTPPRTSAANSPWFTHGACPGSCTSNCGELTADVTASAGCPSAGSTCTSVFALVDASGAFRRSAASRASSRPSASRLSRSRLWASRRTICSASSSTLGRRGVTATVSTVRSRSTSATNPDPGTLPSVLLYSTRMIHAGTERCS